MTSQVEQTEVVIHLDDENENDNDPIICGWNCLALLTMLIALIVLITFMVLHSTCKSNRDDFVIDCIKTTCNGQCIPLLGTYKNNYSPICDKDCNNIINVCKDEFGRDCKIFNDFVLGSGIWIAVVYIVMNLLQNLM